MHLSSERRTSSNDLFDTNVTRSTMTFFFVIVSPFSILWYLFSTSQKNCVAVLLQSSNSPRILMHVGRELLLQKAKDPNQWQIPSVTSNSRQPTSPKPRPSTRTSSIGRSPIGTWAAE